MDKPILEINGKTFKLPEPTMKMWKNVVKFNSEYFAENGKTIADTITACEDELAEIYGVDTDEMDNINPADVLPVYTKTSKYIMELAMSKLNDGADEKNAEKAAEKR